MSDVSIAERILRALPGSRPVWVALWGLLAVIRLGVHVLVLRATDSWVPDHDYLDSAARQVALGYVVIVLLWFGPIFVRRVRDLQPTLDAIAPNQPATAWFPRLTSTAGPIILTLILVAASAPNNYLTFGLTVMFLDIPFLAIVLLPIMSFVWAYGTLLVGLDRLGRAPLSLDAFPEDRTLGMGPVGAVAMSGFWLLFAGAVPLLLVAGSDVTTLASSMAIMAITVGLFGLSMLRLHGQMRTAKARYLAMTRALVAEAYRPVRPTPDLKALEATSAALGASQSLADRAEKLLEWPIDERMVTWMTVVVTGVVTSLVVRFVIEAVGP